MIREDDEALGYWTGERPTPWWEQRSIERCHRILGGAFVAAEIQQAALLMHNGYPDEAEQHRHAAEYGGLPGAP
jgi:hypothetical protein